MKAQCLKKKAERIIRTAVGRDEIDDFAVSVIDFLDALKEQEKPNGKCVNECECWDSAYERGKQDALKEQEKKEIKLHKKHVLTLNRNDEFSMRKLYESVCEKLLDEGEMIITRTDNHENVEFVFYVAND